MQTLQSINPANNRLVGEVSISPEKEIIEKVKCAHSAKQKWKSLGIHTRIEMLRQLMGALKAREQEIILLTIREMGKTLTETKNDMTWDFDYFQEFLDHGPQYLEDEITVQKGKILHRIVYEARGVVACIVPWNFPFANFVWSVIPNLIVGNTVIFKHSEECPLVGKLIEDIVTELNIFPPGVFSEVYGGAEVGQVLVSQNIDMIWFTGSSVVGRKLFDIAGKKQIKAVLEMGGSNPAIIFDDVDIDSIVPKIYRGRFTNCGQVCDAIKRLIVHEKVYDEVVEKLTHYTRHIKIGDPEQIETELGPLAAMRQLQLIESQINASIQAGAKIMIGGSRVQDFSGAYYAPTILVDVDNTMRVWKEEVFGPVLPIVPFATEEEAIRLANDTIYGLGAVVHSIDTKRAKRIAICLEAGFVDINDGNHWAQCNPFGGYKLSGMGCEHGRHGFHELCQFKVIAEG
ncbi:MAG TPA: aldehyde dehydrogenase family protein [Gammaproteobacteria bacterium]|nr:aldehyde dehydrogenase family protein [Gammaproteobacteria bacterium]